MSHSGFSSSFPSSSHYPISSKSFDSIGTGSDWDWIGLGLDRIGTGSDWDWIGLGLDRIGMIGMIGNFSVGRQNPLPRRSPANDRLPMTVSHPPLDTHLISL